MKYYIILLIFIALSVMLIVFSDNNRIFFTISSFIFSIIFTLAVIFSLINKEAITKTKEFAPFIIPALLFIFFELPVLGIFHPENISFLFQDITFIVICMFFYISGIFFIYIDLRYSFLKIQKAKFEKSLIKFDNSKKKLLLINPVNKKNSSFLNDRTTVLPPIALGIVAALTPEEFGIFLIDENFEDFKFKEADLVGITSFTSNVTRAYEIASIYRAKKIPVILGGIHASMMPDEALKYVDAVVIGEAESVWEEVINDFKNKKLRKIYRGDFVSPDKFVIPDRSIFNHGYFLGTIQTSRGCPMKCAFCTVSDLYGMEFRQKSYKDVLDEIENIEQKYFFFVDDNLLGYGKESEERALKLFKGMVERKINKKWSAQISINIASNEEVVKWAAKSGCTMILLGFESIDPDELKSMNKNVNLKFNYQNVGRILNKYGIVSYGSFIYGMDNSTKKIMENTKNFILKNNIDIYQTVIFTPLPGTKMFKDFFSKNRIINNNYPEDWDKYNLVNLTIKLNSMEQEEFLNAVSKILKKLYSFWTIKIKFFKTLINTKNIEAALVASHTNNNLKKIAFSTLEKIEK